MGKKRIVKNDSSSEKGGKAAGTSISKKRFDSGTLSIKSTYNNTFINKLY